MATRMTKAKDDAEFILASLQMLSPEHVVCSQD
jgi:hypothetical protein